MSWLSAFLEEEIGRESFPGAVALVGSGEEVLELAAAGDAVREPERVGARPETLYDLASLTKPLCCAALARAAGWGDLQSSPGRYFEPWKRTKYEGITLEMLWTHTSGLPAWFPLYARGEGADAYRRTLGEIEPEARPGERVTYSDLNFLLLGELLERVLSTPLDRAFREMVAAPCGTGASFLPSDPLKTAATERADATERAMAAALGLDYPRFRVGVVWGEVHDGNACRRGGVAGNAGLFGAARDVWALARRWLTDPAEDFQRDRTAALPEARGLAWQGSRGAGSAVPVFSRRAFGHTGFTGTSLWIDPDIDRIWILLSNRVHPSVRDANFNEVRRRFHAAAYAAAHER
ncbi:MAG TPA: serine hydrolase domain-containing protein [Thermoanaerobaculia bacterium]|nr:serine hydrolase domain-containing protein [Thermoanaerobaculia bacterium]